MYKNLKPDVVSSEEEGGETMKKSESMENLIESDEESDDNEEGIKYGFLCCFSNFELIL